MSHPSTHTFLVLVVQNACLHGHSLRARSEKSRGMLLPWQNLDGVQRVTRTSLERLTTYSRQYWPIFSREDSVVVCLSGLLPNTNKIRASEVLGSAPGTELLLDII